MNINLHIERVMIEGVTLSARERAIVSTSLEQELTRLIRVDGLPAAFPSGGSVPSVPAGGLPMSNNPAQLGQHIAQAIYGGNGR